MYNVRTGLLRIIAIYQPFKAYRTEEKFHVSIFAGENDLNVYLRILPYFMMVNHCRFPLAPQVHSEGRWPD